MSLTGANAIGAVTTSGTVGSFTLNNAQSLSVGSIASGGTILVTATGATSDLTLSSGATLSSAASGNAITLAAGRNFINSAGSAALSASSGRWLVYSAAPVADTFGAMNSNNTAIWNATYAGLPPVSVTQSGNRYLFATQPTLTFTSVSTSKTYGTDATTAVASQYSVSGYQSAGSGAYLADSASTAFSGTPTVTSTGSAATAGVGSSPYTITVAAGSLTALDGYALSYVSSGQLTVTAAPLTITGNNSTVTYNGGVQTNGYGITAGQLFGSDTLTGVSGRASGTNASPAPYADALSGASGSGLANYAISYVNGGLTIDKARLTIIANNDRKSYDGMAYSGGNGLSYLGFVGGETGSALAGTLSYGGSAQGAINPGIYKITASGLSSGNYAIAYEQGTLTVNAAQFGGDLSMNTVVFPSHFTSLNSDVGISAFVQTGLISTWVCQDSGQQALAERCLGVR